MNHINRLLFVLLVLIVLNSITACGGGDGNSSGGNGNSSGSLTGSGK